MTDLPLHVIQETTKSVTLGWTPPHDVEWYTFYVNGQRISNAPPVDKNGNVKNKVTFGKPGVFQVVACGPEHVGVWPRPVTDKPAPPKLVNPVVWKPRRGDSHWWRPTTDTDVIVEVTEELEPYGGGAAFAMNGARNVRVDGELVCHCEHLREPGQSQDANYAAYLLNIADTFWVERVDLGGPGCTNGFAIAAPFMDLQVLSYKIDAMHPVWHVSKGAPAEAHTDAIQTWAGPYTLQMWDGTITTCGTVIQVMPNQYGYSQLGQWLTHNLDARQVRNPLSDEMPYALTKNAGQKWAWDQRNVTIAPLGTTFGANGYPGDGAAGWTPGNTKGWPITGDPWKVIT